jgi:hypothetical protein
MFEIDPIQESFIMKRRVPVHTALVITVAVWLGSICYRLMYLTLFGKKLGLGETKGIACPGT